MLSKRAQQIFARPSVIVEGAIKCALNPYRLDNPSGMINLGVAENHLILDKIFDQLTQFRLTDEKDLPYQQLNGSPEARESLFQFLTKNLNFKLTTPEHIILSTGTTSILESLAFNLCDSDDAIAIPAPFYSGFFNDLSGRFPVKIVEIPCNDSWQWPMEIVREVLASNSGIKALLITQPHNPLGTIYSKQWLNELYQLCCEYQIHLICDEIYQGSVHEGQSCYSLFEQDISGRDNLHLIYGMSKDFALGGFRYGALYTENQKLRQGMTQSCYFHSLSSITQSFVSQLLQNHQWCREFMRDNSKLLKNQYNYLNKELNRLSLNSIVAQAGFFIWLDLSEYIDELDFKHELQLYYYLLEQGQVNILPGQFFASPKPGFFRVCYAVECDYLSQGLERIKKGCLHFKNKKKTP